MMPSFSDFVARLQTFIELSARPSQQPGDGRASASDEHFNTLALALFSLQFSHNQPYRQFCQSHRVTPQKLSHWSQIPAIPTPAFKELDLTSLPADERQFIFRSSGTTAASRSRHFHSTQS